MSWRPRAALVAGLLVAAAPLGAHHSLTSEFDVNRPVTLTGRVTRIEWVNPHAYLHITVNGEHGSVTNWGLQMGSPNGLVRRGWTRHSVSVGDVVTAEGSRAKDGSPVANIRSVVLPSGRLSAPVSAFAMRTCAWRGLGQRGCVANPAPVAGARST